MIADKTRFHDEITLKDIGVNKLQSHRWQSIAARPKKDFEGYIREHKEGQKEITTAGALKICRETDRNQKLRAAELANHRRVAIAPVHAIR